jgi:Rrf2 family protein
MRMNEGVEWAAHCAVLLSLLPEGETLPTSSLAEYHGVPEHYLAKALQGLTRAGVVESKPGRHGGYRLQRPAAEITVLDVVLALEGDDTFFQCTEIRRRGPARVAARAYSPVCGIAATMWRAEQAWRDELRATTIADLAVSTLAQAPRDALDKGARWLGQVIDVRRR